MRLGVLLSGGNLMLDGNIPNQHPSDRGAHASPESENPRDGEPVSPDVPPHARDIDGGQGAVITTAPSDGLGTSDEVRLQLKAHLKKLRTITICMGIFTLCGFLLALFGYGVFASVNGMTHLRYDVMSVGTAAITAAGFLVFAIVGFRYLSIQGDIDIAEERSRIAEKLSSRAPALHISGGGRHVINVQVGRSSGAFGERASTGEGSGGNYFDRLVEINVENLGSYYALVKNQTDKSFAVTIAIAVVGAILLFAGLTAGFVSQKEHLAYLTSGAGIVTEFIASIFFYLYNRTVRQLKEYHDSLLAVQNVLLSFKLAGDRPEGDAKTQMIADMLAYLVRRDRSDSMRVKPGNPKVSSYENIHSGHVSKMRK